MSSDQEQEENHESQTNFIEKCMIALIKKYKFIYDPSEPLPKGVSRHELLSSTFDDIADQLTKIMKDSYVLTGNHFLFIQQALSSDK